MKKPELKNCIDIVSHRKLLKPKDFTNTFKHTYAFDPIPQVRECYVKNITNTNYTLYPYALVEKKIERCFYMTLKKQCNTHANDNVI